MIASVNIAKLRRLIKDYKNAAVDYSWRGGGDPEMIVPAEERLRKTRKALYDYLKECEENAK